MVKKGIKVITSMIMTSCIIFSLVPLVASAATEIEDLSYRTPINDCNVQVYTTCGGSVKCTKATSGFLMETGIRRYKAVPDAGYKFNGWNYELKLTDRIYSGWTHTDKIIKQTNKGNRKSLGRYTFSKVGNKKIEYDKVNDGIQLNRLTTCGECCFPYETVFSYTTLDYMITANFSKI